jgi:stearoyl-CoA desaturase (delta-9 desaturase)
MSAPTSSQNSRRTRILRWLHSGVGQEQRSGDRRVDWLQSAPLIAMHLGCLGVIWVGFSATALIVALALYALRMFAITGFYHRYFSHRSFRTSRVFQFLMGLAGASALQRGPLWWAGHHREHHRHSDGPGDLHSPRRRGLLYSHMGWFNAPANFATRRERVKDLERYPELRLLDRWDMLVAVGLFAALFLLGELLAGLAPALGTSGWQMVVWGFFISTVVLYHATYTINSLAHRFGRRRYATKDDSRNNFLLALLTFGEGWHNNHHHHPAAARQGFYWWEIDLSWYGLKLLSWMGLIWDLKSVPARVREARKEGS